MYVLCTSYVRPMYVLCTSYVGVVWCCFLLFFSSLLFSALLCSALLSLSLLFALKPKCKAMHKQGPTCPTILADLALSLQPCFVRSCTHNHLWTQYYTRSTCTIVTMFVCSLAGIRGVPSVDGRNIAPLFHNYVFPVGAMRAFIFHVDRRCPPDPRIQCCYFQSGPSGWCNIVSTRDATAEPVLLININHGGKGGSRQPCQKQPALHMVVQYFVHQQ